MTPLRRRMQEELQRRNYSDITAVCYLRLTSRSLPGTSGAAQSCWALKRSSSFSFT
jgi:hypothetical protein